MLGIMLFTVYIIFILNGFTDCIIFSFIVEDSLEALSKLAKAFPDEVPQDKLVILLIWY